MILQKDQDGFYQLEYDKIAIKEYQEEVNAKMKYFSSPEERIRWMVENGYYYPELLQEYTMDEIMEIYHLARSFNMNSECSLAKI
jgi:ribonucleoside-diphosphate reductase alpha chain